MNVSPIRLYPGSASEIVLAGVSVVAIPAGVLGGYISNPYSAADQGLDAPEMIYVDPTGPAALHQTATTVPIWPGGTYSAVPGSSGPVWVNAASAGHRFTSVLFQTPTPYPPTPTPPSAFPPSQPSFVAMLKSYLYQEYADDDDLQNFVAAFNGLAQDYLDTFNALNLPVYTGSIIAGALLDWVATGLYGMPRPTLELPPRTVGPFNTWLVNTWAFNQFKLISGGIEVTTDDIYKRILTWHLGKGDGKVFNVRWLKRRIMRFLIGEDGTWPNIDQTYQIGVYFGVNGEVSIRLWGVSSRITGGAIFNRFLGNSRAFNETDLSIMQLPPLPNAAVFQQAVYSGVLDLPFQFNWTVTIPT